MTNKDTLMIAYGILTDLETYAPYDKLTDEEQQTIAAAKDVLARRYTALTLVDCKYDSRHDSEFFSETLQADIIEYHRRADAWPTEQEKPLRAEMIKK